MLLKKCALLIVTIVCVCNGSAVIAKQEIATDYPEYVYAAQVLSEDFGKDSAYIHRFLQASKDTGITLDPLFLGHKDSKIFTDAQSGYTDVQKAQGRELLKILVAQQFPNAKPSNKPTYTANPGAPGTGKTFALQQEFGIDVAQGKFAANAITVGPDLVVMPQMEAYKSACNMPIGEARTKAMVAAYLHDRDFSNAVANFMLMMAITDHLNIVHDSTMTSSNAAMILDYLGKVGYQRTGRIILADRVSRGGALDARTNKNGGFASVTTKDALDKAVASYERITDGSYIGRFDNLSILVQEPEYYARNSKAIEVAKYDPASGKIHVLPGRQKHIDRIMQRVRENEALKPELLTALEKVVGSWEKSA